MIAGHDSAWDDGWRASDRLDLSGRADVLGAADAVDDAIEATGKRAQRTGGKLPPRAMALFANEDYEQVAACLAVMLVDWEPFTTASGSAR